MSLFLLRTLPYLYLATSINKSLQTLYTKSCNVNNYSYSYNTFVFLLLGTFSSVLIKYINHKM